MPVTEDFNPLTDPVPDEIPLTNAPLIRVVAQIRFPMIASIERREFIAPFQEALRKEYPILRQEQSHNLQLGEEGVQTATSRIWRFTDAAENWRVSLAPQFIAIEAKTYSSRGEFLSKLKSVLQHVEEHLDPGTVDRNGIRYIDRVEGEAPESFRPLIRSEVAGVLAAPFEDLTMQTLTQNTFKFPDHEGQLMARWGTMPPNSRQTRRRSNPSTGSAGCLILMLLRINAVSGIQVNCSKRLSGLRNASTPSSGGRLRTSLSVALEDRLERVRNERH